MLVRRKLLKAIGRHVPGDVIELEETDAAAFDLLQITTTPDALQDEGEATPAPLPRRSYRRRDMQAAKD